MNRYIYCFLVIFSVLFQFLGYSCFQCIPEHNSVTLQLSHHYLPVNKLKFDDKPTPEGPSNTKGGSLWRFKVSLTQLCCMFSCRICAIQQRESSKSSEKREHKRKEKKD